MPAGLSTVSLSIAAPAIVALSTILLAVAVSTLPAFADERVPEAVQAGAETTVGSAAREALNEPLFSVVDKTRLAASGNPHDYFSFAPYWWPDPESEDGLPYLRRDGHYNPATRGDATDKQRMIDFIDTVNALTQAYVTTRDERYASRAVVQLRHWFLNPDTRMAPNLRYAQAIPGRVDGRGIGIIESRLLIGLTRSIEQLEKASAMDSKTLAGLQRWYADYLQWMLSSDNGHDEQAKANNHGTWYDAQVVTFARFTDQPAIAGRQLDHALDRLDAQFRVDGSQPLELERTRPWHYANFNLEAWSILLDQAAAMDVDWPRGEARDKLATAYGWIVDHAARPDDWPFKELHGFHPEQAATNLIVARRHGLIAGRPVDALIARWTPIDDATTAAIFDLPPFDAGTG
ncbi:alginate lyase [Salinicola rhizosphaerae]|uniref:Alginate lyase n=1 Tax=Salinicola rhizosphaerae TaxID=1443141 RepID=A0ABQ3E6Z0_9GAMM|nr:alginate lyase [Salinicola rhizosphaerae]